MDEILQRALVHLRGMWHRRWIGLAVAWIVAIIAIAIAYRIPERYEASARVYVDTQSLLRPVMAGLAIQPNLDQQVALMSRTLISRPNIEKLVRMADLDLGVKTNAERDELIDNLMKTLQLGGNVASNLYVISYRDTKPQQAKNVVQSLLTIFVESSLGDKRQDTRGAVRFLDEQIKRYEQSLLLAESRVKDFKLKYMGVPGQEGQNGPDFFGKMAKLGDDIANAKLELRAAEESRDSYKRELAGESPCYCQRDRQLPTIPRPRKSTRALPPRRQSWMSSCEPTRINIRTSRVHDGSLPPWRSSERRIFRHAKRRRMHPAKPSMPQTAIRFSNK